MNMQIKSCVRMKHPRQTYTYDMRTHTTTLTVTARLPYLIMYGHKAAYCLAKCGQPMILLAVVVS